MEARLINGLIYNVNVETNLLGADLTFADESNTVRMLLKKKELLDFAYKLLAFAEAMEDDERC